MGSRLNPGFAIPTSISIAAGAPIVLLRHLNSNSRLPYNRGMELIVYSAWWCPDCLDAKQFLDKHNIPYTDIDIETTPGAAQEVIHHTGKRAIPQFVIDGRWVQPYRPGEGFLYEEMAELLGIVDQG